MKDTKLFETILGLQAPWHISRVALETTGERVHLWVEHAADVRWACPECATALACRDHAEERAWRHLDTCQFQTFVRKVAQPIPYIGVDEQAFRKGHRYHTIVCDLARATVEFVAEERRTESLAAYYAQLTDEQREALKAVAMDMWEPYIAATRDGLPNGEQRIVFDRFHI